MNQDILTANDHGNALEENHPQGSPNLSILLPGSPAKPKHKDIQENNKPAENKHVIEDETGRIMWSNAFGLDQLSVKWEKFLTEFFSFISLPPPTPGDVKARSLKSIFDNLEDKVVDTITQESFNKMLQWFGPLVPNSYEIIEKVIELELKAWFHGKISGKEAESKVKVQSPGTFLLRFSSTEYGCYAITVLAAINNPKHFRILHKPGQGYIMGKLECKTLDEVIQKFSKELHLKSPCPGSIFLPIFSNQNKSRYTDFYSE